MTGYSETMEKRFRYHVMVEFYSLAPGCVGDTIQSRVISKHRSRKAAGRVLGSIIFGSRSHLMRAPIGHGVRVFARDLWSGEDLPRSKCK